VSIYVKAEILMDALLWILLPVLVAAGSAVLSIFMMQARMDVAIAREQHALAEARAQLDSVEQASKDRVKAAEEAAYRHAFDQFLMDFRVEERHYVRETKSHFVNRRSMVMQERLYFRNIPLSNWVEHEMAIEDGDLQVAPPQDCSVFSARPLSDQGRHAPKYLAQ
jgi:hypothetical protein